MPVDIDKKQVIDMYTHKICSGWLDVKKYIESLEHNLKNYSDAFQVKKNYIAKLEKEKQDLELRMLTIPKAKERFSQHEKEEILRKRLNGATCNEIAEEYNCSSATIHRIVKPLKIDLRKKIKN